MSYSLGEAAKELGVSKPTVQRAIKSGKLSAIRRDDGSYDIDPAELRRAFPTVTRNGNVPQI
jgi:excisionase family DNA binding protein